jgi:Tol biopolymer transport system component
MNADGTGLKDLTKAGCPSSQPQQDREPAWSPDGRKVVFVRATNVDSDAWVRAGSLMTVDVASGATARLSAFPSGGPGDPASEGTTLTSPRRIRARIPTGPT